MLFFNLDCTDFAYHHDTRADGGGQIDRYIDRILDGGVTHLLCNTQAERTNYASQAWESFWTGFDPAGPDDQAVLAPLGAPESEAVARWRRLITAMWDLHAQGVDYPGRVLDRARQRGAAAWVSVRMNDVHCQENEAHPIHSDFWRRNPQLRRRGHTGYYAKALDYAQAAVRNHYRTLIEETLSRWDLDGIELDFMREPYLFSRGEEAAGAAILTAWLAEIRALVRTAAEQRGHPIQVGIRVPSRPAVAQRFGLDVPTWTREGLLDVLVPTPRWASAEFDMPLAAWRCALAGTAITLLGGQEILYRPYRGARAHGVTPAQARGIAAHSLQSGADGVYLFNYFPSGQPSGESWWSAQEYPRVLRSLTTLESAVSEPRSHALTGHDVNAPDGGEADDDPLPARGTALSFALPTGPRPRADAAVRLTLDLEIRPTGAPVPPAVSLNEAPPLALGKAEVVNREPADHAVPHGVERCTYAVPSHALAAGTPNRITVTARDGEALLALALTIDIED